MAIALFKTTRNCGKLWMQLRPSLKLASLHWFHPYFTLSWEGSQHTHPCYFLFIPILQGRRCSYDIEISHLAHHFYDGTQCHESHSLIYFFVIYSLSYFYQIIPDSPITTYVGSNLHQPINLTNCIFLWCWNPPRGKPQIEGSNIKEVVMEVRIKTRSW